MVSDPVILNTKLEPKTEAELNSPVLLPWPSASPPILPELPRNVSPVSTSWMRSGPTIYPTMLIGEMPEATLGFKAKVTRPKESGVVTLLAAKD